MKIRLASIVASGDKFELPILATEYLNIGDFVA